ncbi:SusC/RagA family TonB-linked outer membrane protein [Sphingobacterium pedocola]|uniref:SusC/RagA family TonB-linked outer membrane protein n=1 Tax=Sphingobacterium pedocola TaxID=2082722 RepID=A0ABR9TBH2_9SPHI|nr:SusC/RagA family TonB-linked outer membrane protein [Sphingobacterium pedocola]MBE8722002.1 SusC/RagA family TonB-linked outer membrane protein [Sphingobacterium pedocola]
MINYKIVFKTSVLPLVVCLMTTVSFAQSDAVTIKGRVINEYQQPLNNVVINTELGKNGTSTDRDGNFELSISDGSTRIRFESLQYRTKDTTVTGISNIFTLVMVRDIHGVDKRIDLGYSHTSLGELTGSVSTVSGTVLERHPVANLDQTLSGRLAGLTSPEISSELSRANTNLFVRGISAGRQSEPLIVIDGLPVSYNSSQSLTHITPSEIETISVLKDASTQAIYGIQGANGVIVVKTKRGKKGAITVNGRVDQSFQQVITKPIFYSSAKYAELRNLAGFNDGMGEFSQFSAEQLEHFRTGDLPDLYPNNNWYDRYVEDYATMQRAGVNVTGGNDRVSYYSNVNFMHQGGQFKTDQDEYSTNTKNIWVNYRSNVDLRFNDYLQGYVRLSGNIKRERTPGNVSSATVYSSIFQLPSTMYGPLTPEVIDPTNGEVSHVGNEVITTERVGAPTYGLLNRSGYTNHTTTNIVSQFGLDLDMGFLAEGLNLSGLFAYQTHSMGSLRTLQDFERYQRKDDWNVLDFTKKGGEQNTPLRYEKGQTYYYNLTYKGQLDYQRRFGAHSINGTAYMLFQDLSKSNTTSPELLPYKRLSTGAEVNYNYNNRYFFKAVTGYAGSEQYARAYRFIFTPALGASWLASNERFLEEQRAWLSLLKLRGSWGKTANDQSDLLRFAYLDNITVGGGGTLGYLQYVTNELQIGNPMIQAEVSTKTNIGIDLGLFNAITLTADFFKERMENMVVGAIAAIPSYQGVPLSNYPKVNGGIFENKGYELGLRYENVLNARSSFYIQGLYSYNKNTIVHSNEAFRTDDFAYRKRVEGFSHGQSFGYLVDNSNGNGFFNSQSEIEASNLDYGFGTPRVGDLKYRDLNGDGTIDERDQAPLGYGAIPRINYSFAGGLSHGAFDVHFIFQGLGKYASSYTGAGIWETEFDGIFGSLHENSWTAERYESGEKITWPALSLAKSVNHENSDFVLFNRSYLRLKNVEIGYTLGKEKLRMGSVNEIRFTLSGQNLITWDKMKSKDFGPEGGGFLAIPAYRVYSVGVNIVM